MIRQHKLLVAIRPMITWRVKRILVSVIKTPFADGEGGLRVWTPPGKSQLAKQFLKHSGMDLP